MNPPNLRPGRLYLLLASALSAATLAGCGEAGSSAQPAASSAPAAPTETDVITLAAYTVPREAYSKIIPEFRRHWRETTGRDVEVRTSFTASGAQSRAVVGGFEADVVTLAMEADVQRVADAKLITHDWRKATGAVNGGVVTTSTVVIAVRKGNPLGIRGWADLVKPGVRVMMADPRMSGGAQWAVLAAYGAALRGRVAGYPAGEEGAGRFLADVLSRVYVLDKGGRESIINFERGIGDAALTYENEALAGRMAGREVEYVLPDSSIDIENPVAVVDVFADRHGPRARAAAEAFVRFLFTPAAQRLFADHGFRPVDKAVASEAASLYRRPADLFPSSALGDRKTLGKRFFGPDGIYTKLAAEALARRG
jgi:sulfate transport system substrate-binding protein